ncbi:uncharacterized protein LOC131144051 [Malania oleifera]|uniref:uncharacterized protein LOC131144051 n=1 Tax=Malania oleifera TaxID=397392 RepID=UPI0025AEB798|nr:uncharacterized protein LOC131144051 [Malania oleifera]
MDSRFFRNHWNPTSHPRYAPSVRGIPVQHRQMAPSPKAAPKVVSIPVHFVGSEATRSTSAAKIQKVFRGFLVRKSVKRISAIRREVDEIERRISTSEVVDSIRKDSKERLKVTETLMALLLRLDSVRGIDSGVRDLRKAAIKKAIALQETVDAIVSGGQSETLSTVTNGQNLEDSMGNSDVIPQAVDQLLETKDVPSECSINCENAEEETEGKSSDITDLADFVGDCKSSNHDAIDRTEELEDVTVEATLALDLQNCVETAPDSNESKMIRDGLCEDHGAQDSEANKELPTSQMFVENQNATPSASECAEEIIAPIPSDQSDSAANSPSPTERGEEDPNAKPREEKNIGQSDVREGNGNKKNRELIERMMEENEKLMGLMTNLYERNAIQTSLLSYLSQRVEQLERAFVCEKLRRKKKKKRHSGGAGDVSDQSPDGKKCGKRY